MLYREAGDFKTTYRADQQTFPIKSERILFWAAMAVAFFVVPFLINDYWNKAVLMPLLIYAMAALGLNILVGYCGQVSLGTGGFMAVGAFADVLNLHAETLQLQQVFVEGEAIDLADAGCRCRDTGRPSGVAPCHFARRRSGSRAGALSR